MYMQGKWDRQPTKKGWGLRSGGYMYVVLVKAGGIQELSG